MTTSNCPCGNPKSLAECCQPFLSGKKKPQTTEELLRSRYTAFTQGNVDYILATHHSKTQDQVERNEIEDWAKNSKWEGLEIHGKHLGEAKDTEGQIVFVARYESQGKAFEHGEHSFFEKENGDWKFVDARPLKTGPITREGPKVGRNDPCACGSGKKFKKCCAAA